MSMIKTLNSTISSRINKQGDFYQTLLGADPFTPEVSIVESSDFNCGAICNELEFARTVSQYYAKSFRLDTAAGGNLDSLVGTFVNLPRRNITETDPIYRTRFRSIIVQSVNERRGTKWAIIGAVNTFLNDLSQIGITEPGGLTYPYFVLRLYGIDNTDDVITLNSNLYGFLDQFFVGGQGIGGAVSFVGEVIDRVKAAGVDYDVTFLNKYSVSKVGGSVIGSVQLYKAAAATVLKTVAVTKTSNGEVV